MLDGDLHSARGVRAPTLLGERAKIVAMGVVLGLLVLAYLYPGQSTKKSGTPVITRPPVVDVSAFALDPKILATIRDGTEIERGSGLRGEVLDHFLEKSYNIGPAEARALRLPERPMDIERLRAQPRLHRGSLVWVKGQLEEFAEQNYRHPTPRATAYKGQLRTESGDRVVFWVSKPLPQNVLEAKDKWIRVEGFFMKIVDESYAYKDDVRRAPLIVGPRVTKAYPDWNAVDRLDPNIIGRVKNAVWLPEKNVWTNDRDMRTLLVDSQDVPLWHLASFAMKQFESTKETDQHHADVFELKEQYTGFREGKFEQGAPFRLRGTFILARILQAEANPVGIESWSEVWLQIPRMGSKLIPIWIPTDIGEWNYGDSLDIDAFFFKNYRYRVDNNPSNDMHAPLFVAGGLRRFTMVSHPIIKWIGLAFALFVAFVAFLFFRMNRRAKRESEDYKSKLVDRRRQRRSKTPDGYQVS